MSSRLTVIEQIFACFLERFRRSRRVHYSVDPLTGQRYSLPDEVRDAFVPVESSEEKAALDALGEAIAISERARAEGRPWKGTIETSNGTVYLD